LHDHVARDDTLSEGPFGRRACDEGRAASRERLGTWPRGRIRAAETPGDHRDLLDAE
jgi:hypothetical protein